MNKTELVAAVAAKAELSKKDAEKAVSSTIDTIINTVAEGEKIQLRMLLLRVIRFLLSVSVLSQ